jgi:hypothetical protein
MTICPHCHGTGILDEYRLVHYRLPSGHIEVILQQKNTVCNWSTIIVSSNTSDVQEYCRSHVPYIVFPELATWINYPNNPEGES